MTIDEAIDIVKCLAWHARPDEEKIEQAIKTLEQEPCEDCISRKALMIALIDKGLDQIQADDLTEINQIVADLPSIQPKLSERIFVGERMPEDWDEYVITIRGRWGKDEEWDYETTTAYYKNGKWSPSYDVDEGQEWEIIAWMPLPERFRSGTHYEVYPIKYNFCSNCGAKMEDYEET